MNKTKRLYIVGMTCVGCRNKIEKKLRNTAGVKKVNVNYNTGTADIVYDADIVKIKDISLVIVRLGYEVLKGGNSQNLKAGRAAAILAVIVSLYVLLQQFGILNLLVPSKLASAKMGYGMLFVMGLVTSIHCIAMCGGINISQCIPKENSQSADKRLSAFLPSALYNLGRVVSYTVIGVVLGFVGFITGGAGSGISAFTGGILKLFAGALMVVMGINMLGLFPALRKLQPRPFKLLACKMDLGAVKSKSPFLIDLLNGLMPCGPLQSMQIVALASGNPLMGGLSMLLFSLGTVPLMLGLGSFVTALGKRFTKKVMTAGAVLVVVLGLAMLSQGGSLSGLISDDLMLIIILVLCLVGMASVLPFKKAVYKSAAVSAAICAGVLILFSWNLWRTSDYNTINAGTEGKATVADGVQTVTSTLLPGRYPDITIRQGLPVKWIINAPQGSINGCNYKIFIPEYGLEHSFKTGENVIEFLPDKEGTYQYSCWMGMIRGKITVTDDGV